VPQPGTPGKTAAAPLNAVSDAELAVPSTEVLQNATVQQLMTYADNALSNALQVGGWGCLGWIKCASGFIKHVQCINHSRTTKACPYVGTC
jgi:hypothetical protein